MTMPKPNPGEVWIIDAFVAHCLLVVLARDKNSPDAGFPEQDFELWYNILGRRTTRTGETREVATGTQVTPHENDRMFFREAIDNELARLLVLSSDTLLPCGHAVQDHKDALREWQKENLAT